MVPTFPWELIPLGINVIQTTKVLEAVWTAFLTYLGYNQGRRRRANWRYYRRRRLDFHPCHSRLKKAAENHQNTLCYITCYIISDCLWKWLTKIGFNCEAKTALESKVDEWDRVESADASGANGFSGIQMEERLVIEILYLDLTLYRNLWRRDFRIVSRFDKMKFRFSREVYDCSISNWLVVTEIKKKLLPVCMRLSSYITNN